MFIFLTGKRKLFDITYNNTIQYNTTVYCIKYTYTALQVNKHINNYTIYEHTIIFRGT